MNTKIENFDELKSVLSNKEKTVSSIEHFMQPFNLGRTLKNFSNIKQKRFSFTDVLVRLVCTGAWNEYLSSHSRAAEPACVMRRKCVILSFDGKSAH